jgi:toxin ParE1/3/4
MRLAFAPEVRFELIAIGELIRADSPQRAISFVVELERKAYSIARRPRIYRLRPEIAPDVRLATHGSYVILFRIETDLVRVLHIVHGARDLTQLFEP